MHDIHLLVAHRLLEVVVELLIGFEIQLQPLGSDLDALGGDLGPPRQSDLQPPHLPFVQDVGTTQQILPIDLIEVETNITEMQLPILKVLQRDLVGQQLIEGSVEDILDQILDGTDVGETLKHPPQHILEHTLSNIISSYKNIILPTNALSLSCAGAGSPAERPTDRCFCEGSTDSPPGYSIWMLLL